MAGKVKIEFAQPKKVKLPKITITTPPAPVPTLVAPPDFQKPIVIVPEIVYPHRVKRILVHHGIPLSAFYQHMMYSMNPYYAQYAQTNPYYKNLVAHSSGLQNYLMGPEYTAAKEMLDDKVPISSGSPSGVPKFLVI